MSKPTERVNDGPKADASNDRSQRPDQFGEVPQVRLSGNQIAIEGVDEQRQRLLRRFGLNKKQLDALLARLAQALLRALKLGELAAMQPARAVPMPMIPTADAVALSTSSQSERP